MSMEPTTAPAWNSADAIGSALQQYQTQIQQISALLADLDRQKAEAIDAQKMLVGAVAALEQLLKNGQDTPPVIPTQD